MKHILAIDMGTSHCKAVVINLKGEVVNKWQVNSPVISDEPGQHEQDANVLFERIMGLIKKAFEEDKDTLISCVCFSAAMHGLMAVDASGKPLTNIITWADTRSDDYAAALLEKGIASKIYERTGPPIHSMTPLCKLLWLSAEKKEIFDKAYKFISLKEYIFYKLFNKYIIDYSVASATGLFDVYDKAWNKDALEVTGVSEERLSTPVEVTHAETSLLPEYKTMFALTRDVPFIVGASDGALANLGCGAIDKNKLALTIGTSGAVRVVADKPVVRSLNTTFNYLLTANHYVIGGPTNNGGNTLQWFVENIMNDNSREGFDKALKLAATIPVGADGLLFLPYIYGERAPIWNAKARGAFIGLTSRHNNRHMARAVVEAICLALYDVFSSMNTIKDDIDVVYASGGFTQSEFWLQMVADIFGKKVVVDDVADASAIGAAMIGMYSTGLIKDIAETKELLSIGKEYFPVESNHNKYRQIFPLYKSLYQSLKEGFTKISSLNKVLNDVK